jgi:putative glutamine amidotransferase
VNRPLIGITATLRPHPETGNPYFMAYAPNVQAVERAGGLPVLIPAGLTADVLRAIYERVDGILLPGGGDIDPARYGAQPHSKTANIIPERDDTEIAIVQWAIRDDRPILGICRGHQVINVALGGTLIQDIPALISDEIRHDTVNERTMRPHAVRIDPASRLAAILGAHEIEVNSLHHQAIDRAAPGLQITAYAPDGVVEAAEIPGKRFALSVQWHPEDLAPDDGAMQRLFNALVETAAH